MRRYREITPKLNNALFFLAGMLTVVLAFLIVVGVKTGAQQTTQNYDAIRIPDNQTTQPSSNEGKLSSDLEKWQEGVVTYKGKQYRYNSNIRSYLIMGIDNDEPVAEAVNMVSGGQSDALFLLVIDAKKERLSVISINRNTMTNISLCDENGYSLGEMEAQICLQHAFGDGKKLSCTRTMAVVGRLFGNIPISGYLSMNMGGIPLMNDAIGGVEVEILQDVVLMQKGVELKKGEVLNLSGEQAYAYLRGRDVTKYDSASDRLRREEQYIIRYMSKLRELAGGNAAMVVGVYDSVKDYLVTSVDFSKLIGEVIDYEFSENQMYTVPGETVRGETYEEYHVDEDAFSDLIYEIFYLPA